MESSLFNKRFMILAAIVIIAAFSRILTNGWIPNVAPIGALALFSGAYFADKRLAFLIPVLAMLLSDLVIGFHSTMVFVYFAFAITVALGFNLRSHSKLPIGKTAGLTLLSAVLFFLITNAGVWLMYDFYPKSIDGFFASLIAGLPFFRYSLLGDFFYVSLLFGAFEIIKYRNPSLRLQLN